jgi:gamma-glutamyltranspeptidase / glutathione hydrolase
MRFAYGERTELGDPSFVKGMDTFQASMLKGASHIRSKIVDAHTLPVSAYNPSGVESVPTHGTSHIVTADKDGLAITLTTTINLYFGNQVMVPETGIILNDEMNDFSIPNTHNKFGYAPQVTNYIRPGKRPLSSIAPIIVERGDGSLYFVVGAAGGSRIITSTIQNVHHMLDYNMTSAQALAMPRFHDQLIPNYILFEWPAAGTVGFDNATVADMVSRGHKFTWVPPGLSSAQAIRVLKDGSFEAAGEPRQMNSAGYVL